MGQVPHDDGVRMPLSLRGARGVLGVRGSVSGTRSNRFVYEDQVKKVYRGLLELGSNGEEDELLRIAGSEEFLAELVMEDMEEFGDFLTVRYFTAEKEL